MEELLQAAPDAHEHLSRIENPAVQEAIGSQLLQLSHGELVTSEEGLVGATHTRVPETDYSPEQAAHHDRVGSIMADVAAVTVEVDQRLRTDSPDILEGLDDNLSHSLVMNEAVRLTSQKAVEAKKAGDTAAAVKSLETMLAVSLIEPQSREWGRPIRELVAEGMEDELLEAMEGLDGIVAIGRFGRGPADVASCLSDSANLLRAASGLDFDDRFEHKTPLVAPGLPDADVARRQAVIEALNAAELTALAKNTVVTKHNPSHASSLAVKALDKFTQDPDITHMHIPIAELPGIIETAVDLAHAARDPEAIKRINHDLARMRDRRSAGLKPYRVNDQATYTLDETLVQLVRHGRLEEASALLSSSPHELDAKGNSGNLDAKIMSQGDMTDAEKLDLKDTIERLHLEKRTNLRIALAERGATNRTINEIIGKSMDPDSALDIDPAFWERYNELLNRGRDPQEQEQYFKASVVSRAVQKLIEEDSRQLGRRAEMIEGMLDAEVKPEFIVEEVYDRFKHIQEPEVRKEYLRQCGEVGRAIEADKFEDELHDRRLPVFKALTGFEEPLTALKLAERIYGEGVAQNIPGFFSILHNHTYKNELIKLEGPRLADFEEILNHVPPGHEVAVFTGVFAHKYGDHEGRMIHYRRALDIPYVKELLEYEPKETAENLLSEIFTSDSPSLAASHIVEASMGIDFLQEAHLKIDISGHVVAWRDLIHSIPEGREGKTMKQQIISRLKLGIGEDQSEAIRIFREVAPDDVLLADVDEAGLELIRRLLEAESMRGFPSAKPTKLKDIFLNPEYAALYAEAYALKQAGDPEAIRRFRESNDLATILQNSPLSELVAEQKQGAARYREQERAAKRWLRDYSGQGIKATKLIEAWKARQFALENGVDDNPTEILHFAAVKGTEMYARTAIEMGTTDVTYEEFAAKTSIAGVIGSRYAPSTSFQAIERMIEYEREHGPYPPKKLQAGSGEFRYGDEKYKAEILAGDDPRGFTIGFDTGCCMTLDGMSESCIWAGYEDPRYAFFAVYGDNGQLRAQSIMYLYEDDMQKILVVDNIEVNEGTNLAPIADVYRQALLKFAADQGLDIDAINVGVSYTAAEILANMPEAAVAPASPKQGVYTDAHSQRVLWQSVAENEVV